MAGTPNSLRPTGPTMKMMPEDSRKVCILNGNHQIDRVIKGKWTTLKVLPRSGLSKDIYQLGETIKASSGKDTSFTEQMLFSDGRAVYQLPGKGVVKYPRLAFIELEAKGGEIVDGRDCTVVYVNGKSVASNMQTTSVAQPRATSKGHGASM